MKTYRFNHKRFKSFIEIKADDEIDARKCFYSMVLNPDDYEEIQYC